MASGQWHKKSNKHYRDSFLEALRDLGASPLSDFQNENPSPQPQPHRSGVLKPGEIASIGNSGQKENRYRQLFFQEKSLRQEERSLKRRDDHEIKLKIEQLRTELVKFSEKNLQLEEQLKIAIIKTETPEIGKYHVSFLEQLINFVAILRSQAESAASWLAVFNQRNKKKSYYWGHVKKSGSKFFLSADRYPATQAG